MCNVRFLVSHGRRGPLGSCGLVFVALGSAEKNHNKKNVHYPWTALNMILFFFFPKEKTCLPYF